MKADKQLVERLAKLSRLEFNDDEIEKMIDDFNNIVAFMDKLKEVDTDKVELQQELKSLSLLRDDETPQNLSRHEVLKNAPDTDGVFFRISKVLDK